ncbi:MAG TPA: hypothetical protein DEA94_15165 [Rhodobacteraceae bacterium]|nr:hypothetical protein [Paracoccaceae bacterium]
MSLWFCSRVFWGQWHGFSDPKPERALKVRLGFMLFCGLDLHSSVPRETTHCQFRKALVKQVFTMIFLRRSAVKSRTTG